MHFPYSISLFGQQILLHSICELLGVMLGYRYYLFLKRKNTDIISTENRLWILAFAALGAVLGSHIIGSLENVPEWSHVANPLKYFWGNKTLLGGLLGGLVFVEMIKKMIGEKQNSGDLFVFPLLLAIIIGRIGCFSAGVYENTFGIPTSLLTGMDLGDGVRRHPVALYEVLFLLLLWPIFYKLQASKQLANGALFKLFMISYCVFRFLLDFIKPGWHFLFGLGTIQLTALFGLLYYIRYIIQPSLLRAKTT